ncbi:hypothetical protein ES703_115027 [subsurface metagenome]
MVGEAVLLRRGVRVLAEPLLVLEVEDKGPDLVGADVPGVGGPPLGAEVALQVRDAGGDGAYGLLTLALGPSAEGVALDEDPELGGGVFG